MLHWTWNDKLGSRGRKAACLLVSPEGAVYRFNGGDIPHVVKVLKTTFHKDGKWSNTDYACTSPNGWSVIPIRQSFEEGQFFPDVSWEECAKRLGEDLPAFSANSLEEMMRVEFPQTAARFDENRRAMEEMI